MASPGVYLPGGTHRDHITPPVGPTRASSVRRLVGEPFSYSPEQHELSRAASQRAGDAARTRRAGIRGRSPTRRVPTSQSLGNLERSTNSAAIEREPARLLRTYSERTRRPQSALPISQSVERNVIDENALPRRTQSERHIVLPPRNPARLQRPARLRSSATTSQLESGHRRTESVRHFDVSNRHSATAQPRVRSFPLVPSRLSTSFTPDEANNETGDANNSLGFEPTQLPILTAPPIPARSTRRPVSYQPQSFNAVNEVPARSISPTARPRGDRSRVLTPLQQSIHDELQLCGQEAADRYLATIPDEAPENPIVVSGSFAQLRAAYERMYGPLPDNMSTT